MPELAKYGWKVVKFIDEDDMKYKESSGKNEVEKSTYTHIIK